MIKKKDKSIQVVKIKYPSYGNFILRATNFATVFRGTTFLDKEPTTLEWMQTFIKESWLIDIGSNIGIYTIPASLFHAEKVISIEAEPQNYNELLSNLKINRINTESVISLPLAISTKYANQYTKLFLEADQAGQSLHQVGEDQDHMLNPVERDRVKKSVYCISLSHIINISGIPKNVPLHIKVDVDGNEPDVCESLFSSGLIHRISSIQVELNTIHIESHKLLMKKFLDAGFTYSEEKLKEARDSEGFLSGPCQGCCNYNFIPSNCPILSQGEAPSDAIKKQHLILEEKYG